MDEVKLPPRQRRKVRRRHPVLRVLAAVVTMLVVLAVIGSAVGWWLLTQPQVDVEAGAPVQLEIPRGSTSAQIGGQLAAAGVVPNATMFRIQLRLENAGDDLKAGVYELSTGMAYDEVIRQLSRGPEITYFSVTIPEGFVVDQIAERMEAQAGVPAFSVSPGMKIKGKTKEFAIKAYKEFNDYAYHSPQDEMRPNWDFSGFVVLARFTLDVARNVANADGLPTWNAGDEFRAARDKHGVK